MYSILKYNSTIKTIFQNHVRLNQNVDNAVVADAVTNIAIKVGALAKNINEEFCKLADTK